jgi:ribosomal protein S18 acetylase RimI-like enzyme
VNTIICSDSNSNGNNNISDFKFEQFDQFIAYLNEQLSDNGRADLLYFMPLERAQSSVSIDKAASFRRGLAIPYNKPGWRKMWLCHGANGQLIGHIDLRAYAETASAHRCQLGMGVHRDHRQAGLGKKLIAHAEQWARQQTSLNWIDLDVLSDNLPAIKLYQATGFNRTGEIQELYQLDEAFFAEVSMSKKIR